MSELEDRINSVLGDPAQLEKITRLAQSLMGGARDSPAGPENPAAGTQELFSQFGIDPETISRVGGLLGMHTQDQTNNSQALLEAMKPYLSDKRRQKIDRAMKLARLAKLAGLAMGEMESGND